MRKLTTLVLVFLFLAVLVPFAPPATAAYDWEDTPIYTEQGSATEGPRVPVAMAEYGDDFLLYRWGRVATCTVAAETTCGAETTIANGFTCDSDDFCGMDAHGTGTEVLSCAWHSGTVPKVFYTDDGTNHATKSPITGSDTYTGCTVWNLGSGTWLFATVNDTTDVLSFSKTTDFGSTWALTNVSTSFTPDSQKDSVNLAAKSSTEYGIAATNSADEIKFYKTTNGGTTWDSGVTANGAGSGAPDLEWTGSNWIIGYTNGGMAVLKSTNGVVWSSQSVNTNGGTFEKPDFHVVNETQWYMASGTLETGSFGDSRNILAVAWTNNTGLTYTSSSECSRTAPDYGVNQESWGASAGIKGSAGILHDPDTGVLVAVTTKTVVASGGGNWATATTGCFTNVGAIASGVGATDTVALANDPLGFDVDATGSIIIIRENDHSTTGTNVSTYSAVTLDQLGGPTATTCGRVDSVIAEQNHVGYVHCSTATDPTEFRVRSTSLGAPQFPASCPNCAQDITLSGFSAAGGDGLLQLGQIASFPISHTNIQQTGAANADNAFVAWAFSGWVTDGTGVTGPGRIGVDMFTNKETIIIGDGGGDVRNTAEIAYGAATLGARQICVSPTSDELVYRVIAVHEDFASTRFRIQFEFDTGANTRPELDGAIFNEGSFGGLEGARGVSCTTRGASKALLTVERGATDEVYLVNATDGTPYWGPKLITGSVSRGAAISGDGLWFAIVDGETIRAGNATTGAYTVSFTKPAGSIVGMEIDPFGQTLWVATDEGTTGAINKYSLTAFTTITPCCFLPNPDTGGGTGTGGLAGSGGPLDPAAAGAALGVGSFGGGLFLAILTMIGMGAMLAGVLWKYGIALAGAFLGIALGFLLSWAFGWLTAGAVFVTVLAIAGFFGGRFYLANRAGG